MLPTDPPPVQQSLSVPSQPPQAKTASLHEVIQALHERAAQPNPSIAQYTPRKRREYGSAYCVEHTVDGMIRRELSSKKQLARRGGYWDVIGDDYYLDSDHSYSEEEDQATDGDEDTKVY